MFDLDSLALVLCSASPAAGGCDLYTGSNGQIRNSMPFSVKVAEVQQHGADAQRQTSGQHAADIGHPKRGHTARRASGRSPWRGQALSRHRPARADRVAN